MDWWIDGWMHGWMEDGWGMDGWMERWMDGQTDWQYDYSKYNVHVGEG